MRRSVTTIFLLAILPAAAFAQWSCNVNWGWLDNACPAWKVYGNKPFSIWGNGWQAGGGLEYRSKGWLAFGSCGSYQTFRKQPVGSAEIYGVGGQTVTWAGQSSWQAPVELYARLIRPQALLSTNLKLGLGVMASHIGKLSVASALGYVDPMAMVEVVPGTGETAYRPFGQISAGIKIPIAARLGLTVDYGYLSTFDSMVRELPFKLGLDIKW
jgi:hypothetical protein